MALYTTIKDQKVAIGDEVELVTTYMDGEKAKKQIYTGLVTAIKNVGAGKSFTVRKVASFGVGVERIFAHNWPYLESIKVLAHNRVRRAKLYYMRNKVGKVAEQT